ncbi:MAG: hypothetical protein AAF211_08835 [Myxococcota bacterium]
MMGLAWLLLGTAAAKAGSCTITAEGAPTLALDCARASLWEVNCKVPARGKRRVRFVVPEWDVEAETRLPLATDERFRLTLLGPKGSPGTVTLDGLNPQNATQLTSALDLCRSSPTPATLRVEVTTHERTGFAEEIDKNGVVNRVPTWSKGQLVASAEATIRPPLSVGAAPLTRPSAPVKGRLQVRRDDGWVDLEWSGRKQQVPAEGGAVTLLRLDFPKAQVERALGPGEAAERLADDLTRWLSGDASSRLGLVAFRKSEIVVPIAEVPSFDLGPGGWRRARGGTTDFAIGPVDGSTVRVALAFRTRPLDPSARDAIEAVWTQSLSGS